MKSQYELSIVFGGFLVSCLAAMTGCPISEPDDPPTSSSQQGQGGSSSTGSIANGGSGGAHTTNGVGGATCSCDDGNECTEDLCVDGACTQSPKAQGSPCEGSKYCDGQGSCVACNSDANCTGKKAYCQNHECVACDDGEKNGDETDVDCGNILCGKCKGDTCNDKSECASGFCTDSVCCNEACDVACYACNLVDMNAVKKLGECNPVDFMSTDGQKCEDPNACSGTGDCKTASGNACTQHNTCASGKCKSGICVTAAGGPCTYGGECESGLCDTNTHLCLP